MIRYAGSSTTGYTQQMHTPICCDKFNPLRQSEWFMFSTVANRSASLRTRRLASGPKVTAGYIQNPEISQPVLAA